MKLAIYAGSGLPFDAETLNERPLGGTETAVIRLAEVLAKRGVEVIVFTPKEAPRSETGVKYAPLAEVMKLGAVSAFISVRDFRPLVHPLPTKVRLLWTGDAADQPATFGIGDKRVANLISGFLAVSHWQANTLSQVSGFPITKTFVLGNGVHEPYFADTGLARVRKRLIYTSTPYRGLKLLPEIFAKLKTVHPDAELRVVSGFDVYAGLPGFGDAAMQEFEATKAVLMKLPGCTLVGNITQAELAKELLQASVLSYPNTFLETSCISALEAQAAGAVVVTSKRGALPETVGAAGIFIEGDPGTEPYTTNFVAALDRLLSDDELWKRYSALGREQIGAFSTWEHVGDRLLGYLKERFEII